MFRFRLQNVLDIREKNERKLASQLVEAVSQERIAKEELARLQNTRSESVQKMTANGTSRSAGELMTFDYIIQHLQGVIEEANVVVENAENSVAEAKEKLQIAFQDRRVLDRLKERQNDQYKASAMQADRQSMDELAVLRYSRGND